MTPLLGAGGRVLRRPNDAFLSEASGRKRGGEDSLSPIEALEAGRRALAEEAYGEALIHLDWPSSVKTTWFGRGTAVATPFSLPGRRPCAGLLRQGLGHRAEQCAGFVGQRKCP